MGKLTYDQDQFYLDGAPYVILSGAMHYFRIPRKYWHDRLLKLKECGFNTVETYTCWNLHEPEPGIYNFSGDLDVEAYVAEAESLGLNVILRPGPYICAEWEFGGLPWWLLRTPEMPLRCYEPAFISILERYYDQLLSRLKKHFSSCDGNIIMLQIENEYGSYGNDKQYLKDILRIYKKHNIDCLFYTSDGSTMLMLQGGTLEDQLAVANFGSKTINAFSTLKSFFPRQPIMCGEFWCGWFDHWREPHHTRPTEEVIAELKQFMKMRASINLYMFHGGTNFGFMNGANYEDFYKPTVTSYDYGAPLTEAGDRTPLYYKIRALIGETYGELPPITAKESSKIAYGQVILNQKALLFDNLDVLGIPVGVTAPLFMEQVGQGYGYTLYSTILNRNRDNWKLIIETVHDRALIFTNGKYRGVYERWDKEEMTEHPVTIPSDGANDIRLDILVENMGRINYGPKLLDRKGIHGIRFDYQYHFGWKITPLPMNDLSRLSFTDNNGISERQPAFYKGVLTLDDNPCDTFVRLDGFTKGFISVNGINIGRYFNSAGPQKTLYLPAPFLKKGNNEIIVFESDFTVSDHITFTDAPVL